MPTQFLDLIKMPYLLLIIEYLDDNGLCKCNNFRNDILNLTSVNKEIFNYIKSINKLSFYYPEKEFPKLYQSYFNNSKYCLKHIKIKESDLKKIISGIKNLERIKKKRTLNNNMLIDYKLSFQENIDCEFIKEFIHCESYIKASDLKMWISKNTKLSLKGTNCCQGLGFPISFHKQMERI